MQKKVLIVDDEKNIVDIIAFNLKKEGFQVIKAADGEQGLKKTLEEKPDLILLDIMMPKMDGYETCKKIRERLQTPIIMLTARAEEVDKVLGLELGADDYVTKPFGIRELVARVKANLRRTEALEQQTAITANQQQYGRIVINLDRYEVQKDGKVIDLTYREFELLKFLAQQKGQVFSREALLEKVWGYEYYGDVRTVDVTVRRLREKIEDDPGKPTTILTKRGVGYYFDC
ncbi:MAG TPA: response regulator transcription factor [Candidatus Coprocola pullicola]|nr:response regulator transcription factor [Candidatus Coprocola pullicola]